MWCIVVIINDGSQTLSIRLFVLAKDGRKNDVMFDLGMSFFFFEFKKEGQCLNVVLYACHVNLHVYILKHREK